GSGAHTPTYGRRAGSPRRGDAGVAARRSRFGGPPVTRMGWSAARSTADRRWRPDRSHRGRPPVSVAGASVWRQWTAPVWETLPIRVLPVRIRQARLDIDLHE